MDLKTAKDPGALFLGLWQLMASVDINDAANAPGCSRQLQGKFGAALSADNPGDASNAFWTLLCEAWPSGLSPQMVREQVAVSLCAMRAIDDLFLLVHPRTVLLAPDVPTAALPLWLEVLAERRTIHGAYAQNHSHRLLTRGPLSRAPTSAAEVPGYSLPEQFAALQVVPLTVRHGLRELPIVMKVVDQAATRGVPPGKTGAERIAILPVADEKEDLQHAITMRDENEYLAVLPGADLRPVEKVLATLDDCDDADVFLLPELVFESAHVEALSEALDGRRAPRIIVAGSGLVDHEQAGNPKYNAGSVLNGLGASLWAHRKTWAYWMLEQSAGLLDLQGRSGHQHLREDITMGGELTMVDIDSFGRCIVLICQDFQMPVAVEDILTTYQPDWVFVPILDTGTGFERWPRVRASNLAGLSQARFLIASSLAMTHWLKDPEAEPAIGLAIGPAQVARANDDDANRAIKAVKCISTQKRYGIIEWRSGDGWETSGFNSPS
ncbi:hypothetical protein [Sphingobium yanoikuyae]|uniref:hypothetical protein n=1 Tax=Sphingobium yanoikuyae TaxID=13690 RepID=UPI00345EF403